MKDWLYILIPYFGWAGIFVAGVMIATRASDPQGFARSFANTVLSLGLAGYTVWRWSIPDRFKHGIRPSVVSVGVGLCYTMYSLGLVVFR